MGLIAKAEGLRQMIQAIAARHVPGLNGDGDAGHSDAKDDEGGEGAKAEGEGAAGSSSIGGSTAVADPAPEEVDAPEGEDGDGEVVALARKSLRLLGGEEKQTLLEG